MANTPASEALRRVQDFLASDYFESERRRLTIEKIYLRGQDPQTEVVVIFRMNDNPSTYGWAHPVLDPEEPSGIAQYLEMHLAETVLTRAGHESYVPGEDGVTWLPNFQDY